MSIEGAKAQVASPRPPCVSQEILVSSREALTTSVLLFAVLLMAYGNVVFQGRSLVYSNNHHPFDSRHAAETYGPDFVPREVWQKQNLLLTANFHDPWSALGQWEPGGVFLRQGLARGEWPLWDPYVGAGAPAMENMTSTFFFPPYFLMVVLGNTVFLKNVYFLMLVFSSGLFSYIFVRKHGLSPEASFFAAIVYMLGGGVSQEVGSYGGQVAASLPFLLYMTRRFLDRPTVRRTAALAASFAAGSLAGLPPMMLPVFSFTAFYGCWMVLAMDGDRWSGASRWRVAGSFAVAVILSLGLVAFYFLPIFHLLADVPRQVADTYRNYGLASLPPVGLYQLVSPTLLDGFKVFTDPAMRGLVEPWQILPYVGLLPILASFLVGKTTPAGRGPLLPITLWAAALLTLKLLGVQPVSWTGLLPSLNSLRWVPYGGILFNCFFAILGALGVESLRAGRVTPARAAAGLLGCLVVLLSLRQIATAHGLLQHPHAARWHSDWQFLFALAVSFSSFVLIASWLRAHRISARVVVFLALGCCLVEGVTNTFYPRQKAWDVWSHPVPYVEKLMTDAGSARVFAGGGTLTPNATSAYEIFGINSLLAFNSHRVFQLYNRYFSPDVHLFLTFATKLPPESVLDHANVEFLTIPDFQTEIRQELEERRHEIWSEHGSVRIYRRSTLPRYYFSSAYRLLEPAAALEAIGSSSSGKREIILEEPPTFSSRPNRVEQPEVEILRFGRNGYALEVEAPGPGLVYCSESFFRGWAVRVNGEPAKILRANFAFRAVEVPAGRVVLELSYWPPGLTWGLIISAISLLVAGAGIWRSTEGAVS